MHSPRDEVEPAGPIPIQRPFPIQVSEAKRDPLPSTHNPQITKMRWAVTGFALAMVCWFLVVATGAANGLWSWLQVVAPGLAGGASLAFAMSLWQQFIDAEESHKRREADYRNRRPPYQINQPQGPINSDWDGA